MYISLKHYRKILQLTCLNLVKECIQADFLSGLFHHSLLSFGNKGIRIGFRLFFIILHLEDFSGIRHGIQSQNLNRHGWRCLLDSSSLVVNHGTNLTEGGSYSHNIPDMKCTLLYQKTGNGTSTLIELRLNHYAIGFTVRIGLEFQNIRLQGDIFQKIFQTFSGFRGYGATDGTSAIIFRNQIISHEFLLYLLYICRRFINLIDGYNNLGVGSLGMVNCLYRLRLNSVIGSHNQHGNIRRLCSTHTHSGKCLMSGGIQERNDSRLTVHLDGNLISTDRLCNAAMLPAGHIGVSNRVQNGRLTVIDVSHNNNDRGTGLQILLLIDLGILHQLRNHIDLFFLFAKDVVFYCNILRFFIGKFGVQCDNLSF